MNRKAKIQILVAGAIAVLALTVGVYYIHQSMQPSHETAAQCHARVVRLDDTRQDYNAYVSVYDTSSDPGFVLSNVNKDTLSLIKQLHDGVDAGCWSEHDARQQELLFAQDAGPVSSPLFDRDLDHGWG